MPLHIDYRPKTFKTFYGNGEMLESLKSVLGKENPPHAFLFTGGHGCGKTTLARIVAKKLGCHEHDFIEIDSGDNRGIDTVREIRQKMNLQPIAGPCRVYFIDECHSSTRDAQTALLKALEHPPKHVYFILATTNPEKLLPTIKSRCSTFEVKPLSELEMMELLKRVTKREKKSVPAQVLKQIAKDSLGHPRNALVVLDKVIDLKPAKMLLTAKQTAEKESQVIELCRAIMNKEKWPKITTIIKSLQDEPETIRRAILGYASAVLLNSKQGNARAYVVLDAFSEPLYDTGMPGLVKACYEALIME